MACGAAVACSGRGGLAEIVGDAALAIDPDYAPAHAQLGWIVMYGDNDLAGAGELPVDLADRF